MGRSIQPPTPLKPVFTGLLPISKGGTGAQTIAEAIVNLGGISLNTLGAPSGIATQDSNGDIPITQLGSLGSTAITVIGPTAVNHGQVVNYTISNYDSFKTYTVTSVAAGIIYSNGLITLTAPTIGNTIDLTINGRTLTIAINGSGVIQPSILSPVTGATGLSNTLNLSSTAFSVIGGVDTPLGSDWQLSTSSTFATILQSVTASSSNLTTWSISGLAISTLYYVRTRQKGSALGYSAWSPTVSFTTKAVFLPTAEYAAIPTSNTVSYNAATVSLNNTGTRLVTSTGTVYSNTTGYWVAEVTLTLASSIALTDAHISGDGLRVVGGNAVFFKTGSTWVLEANLPFTGTSTNYTGYTNDNPVNSDGSRVLLGNQVFVRTNTVWALEATLALTVPSGATIRGGSITAAGDRVAFSYITTAGSVGSLIYTRTGTSWTQETFPAAIPVTLSTYPYVPVLSGDGYSLLLGNFLFTRSGTTWTYSNTFPATSPYYILDYNGGVVVGASSAPYGTGGGTYLSSFTVFSNTGGGWTQQPTISLTGSTGLFGIPSLSSDGSVLASFIANALGSPGNFYGTASVGVFT